MQSRNHLSFVYNVSVSQIFRYIDASSVLILNVPENLILTGKDFPILTGKDRKILTSADKIFKNF